MPNQFNFSCQCRSLTGTVELPPLQKLTRLVCYCEDCQAYARHLKPSEPVLGPHGGTDIVQVSPAHFHIKRGMKHLSNLSLSETGIYRWHTSCCNSPLCNTPRNPAMPFVGMITNNLVGNQSTLESRVGPVRLGVCAGRQHPISAPWPVSKGMGFKAVTRTLLSIGRWRLAGDDKRSTLINNETGRPVVEPYTLTDMERSELYAPAPAT